MSAKISSAFRARLDSLPPDALLRAIVVLDTPPSPRHTGKRLSPEEKRAVGKAVQEAARTALGQLDRLLETSGGKRLQDQPNILGTILVETTPAGVDQLARLDAVKAVIEDQGLYFVTPQTDSTL